MARDNRPVRPQRGTSQRALSLAYLQIGEPAVERDGYLRRLHTDEAAVVDRLRGAGEVLVGIPLPVKALAVLLAVGAREDHVVPALAGERAERGPVAAGDALPLAVHLHACANTALHLVTSSVRA